MTEVKVEVPLRNEESGSIVGILRRHDGSSLPSNSGSSSPRPITLILHGVLAHKDQLFHRMLAHKLPLDSFRFDFRHAVQGGESTHSAKGWHMARFGLDVLDIHTVVRHLRRAYNYHVESIVSHSRGTMNSWQYFWDLDMRRRSVIDNSVDDFVLDHVPFYVAIAGRWDMERMRQRFPSDLDDFHSKGYYEWKVRVASKNFSVHVTKDMVDEFCSFPMQQMVPHFPVDADCLLLHGTLDGTVPVQDAFAYRNTLQHHMQPPRRRANDTQLHLVEGADHAFKGHFDEVVRVACQWLDARRSAVRHDETGASPSAKAFTKQCALGGQSGEWASTVSPSRL